MSHQTLLVTVSGNDRPGVTRSLFGALAMPGVEVLDIEQLVVRGRLVMGVLLGIHENADEVRRAVRLAAAEVDMDVSTVLGAREDDTARRDRVDVTVLGAPLLPDAVASVATTIAERGGNIDRIRRVAAYPVTALVFETSGASVADLRRELASVAAEIGIDVAVQASALDRRGQHLVVMDVDSTVIQDEVIDLLAEEAGVLDAVASITERAMSGELDFAASLRERVALLSGLDASVLDRVRQRIRLTPGARTLCRTLNALGYRVALVSGGFHEVVDSIGADLDVHAVRANRLEIVDGRLTGAVVGEIVDRAGKRLALEALAREFGIPMQRTIAIGDGANDVDMLMAAGLGVAFNGKAAAREAADAAVSVPYLDSVLYLLGITREEVEGLDAS